MGRVCTGGIGGEVVGKGGNMRSSGTDELDDPSRVSIES